MIGTEEFSLEGGRVPRSGTSFQTELPESLSGRQRSPIKQPPLKSEMSTEPLFFLLYCTNSECFGSLFKERLLHSTLIYTSALRLAGMPGLRLYYCRRAACLCTISLVVKLASFVVQYPLFADVTGDRVQRIEVCAGSCGAQLLGLQLVLCCHRSSTAPASRWVVGKLT